MHDFYAYKCDTLLRKSASLRSCVHSFGVFIVEVKGNWDINSFLYNE